MNVFKLIVPLAFAAVLSGCPAISQTPASDTTTKTNPSSGGGSTTTNGSATPSNPGTTNPGNTGSGGTGGTGTGGTGTGGTTTSFNLTVTSDTNGTVSSTPAGINCGTECSHAFAAGSKITLTPKPSSGFQFKAWTGACTGTMTCEVALNANATVGASFEATPVTKHVLTVTSSANGSVTSTPAGIDCGSTCTQTLGAGSVVTLTAKPVRYSVFKGWTGACTGANNTCAVTMDAAKTVGAQFEVAPNPKVEIQLYNVDDTATAQVNTATILTTPLNQDSGRVDISKHFTSDVNRLDLQLWQSGGPYTYGFRVWLNSQLILEDQCGTVGVASCNANDVGEYVKYYNRIIIRRDGTYTAVSLDRKQIMTGLNKPQVLNATVKGQAPSNLHWSGNIPGKGWIDLPGTTATYTHTAQVPGSAQVCVGGNATGESIDAAMCASVVVPKLEVRLFNVDDIETALIDSKQVLKADFNQDTGRVDLTQYLTGTSHDLMLTQSNVVAEYAFGFQVFWQGKLVLDQSCGVVYGVNCDSTTNPGARYLKHIMLRDDGSISIVNLYTARHKTIRVGETYWIGAEIWGVNGAGGLVYSYGNPSGQWSQLPNNSIAPTAVGSYTVCASIPSLPTNPAECAILDVIPTTPVFDGSAFVQKARQWVNAGLPYAQYVINGSSGYRADCSGLISFAWGLSTPGAVTWTLKDYANYVTFDEVQPGDAVNNEGGPGGHVMLFAGWVDGAWNGNGNRQARFVEENGAYGAVENVYWLHREDTNHVTIPVLTPYIDTPTWVAQRKR
jgi:Divergent InlB B-repeat domain